MNPIYRARRFVKKVVGPSLHKVREFIYQIRFHSAYGHLKKRFGSRVQLRWKVNSSASADSVWKEIFENVSSNVHFLVVSLNSHSDPLGINAYWSRYSRLYAGIGNGREKAVEHALTFGLIDFEKVNRYCDVASSLSPLSQVFKNQYPQVEFWRQDLAFKTDLNKQILGGFAQNMQEIESGFFDAMALHCSFEHFERDSDIEFLLEVDRVLSPQGVCLIIPLYLDCMHRIFLDPTLLTLDQVSQFDQEADLCATYHYRQEHGRYYSPETFRERIIKNLPPALNCTLVRFTGQDLISSEVYLNYAVLLHRKRSLLKHLNEMKLMQVVNTIKQGENR